MQVISRSLGRKSNVPHGRHWSVHSSFYRLGREGLTLILSPVQEGSHRDDHFRLWQGNVCRDQARTEVLPPEYLKFSIARL